MTYKYVRTLLPFLARPIGFSFFPPLTGFSLNFLIRLSPYNVEFILSIMLTWRCILLLLLVGLVAATPIPGQPTNSELTPDASNAEHAQAAQAVEVGQGRTPIPVMVSLSPYLPEGKGSFSN